MSYQEKLESARKKYKRLTNENARATLTLQELNELIDLIQTQDKDCHGTSMYGKHRINELEDKKKYIPPFRHKGKEKY